MWGAYFNDQDVVYTKALPLPRLLKMRHRGAPVWCLAWCPAQEEGEVLALGCWDQTLSFYLISGEPMRACRASNALRSMDSRTHNGDQTAEVDLETLLLRPSIRRLCPGLKQLPGDSCPCCLSQIFPILFADDLLLPCKVRFSYVSQRHSGGREHLF